MKNGGWKRLSSSVVHRNKHWLVRQDDVIRPDGAKGPYQYIDRKDFASIVPLDSDGKLYLVRQWRYLFKSYSWEFPRGSRDKNEAVLESARRELQEETGLKARRWQRIGKSYLANSLVRQSFYTYIASDLRLGSPNLEGSELGMIVKKFSVKQVEQMIERGMIKDSVTITSFYLFER